MGEGGREDQQQRHKQDEPTARQENLAQQVGLHQVVGVRGLLRLRHRGIFPFHCSTLDAGKVAKLARILSKQNIYWVRARFLQGFPDSA
jgi:hypothetical protein